MGESFESKLIAASSRDVFRKAKQILHAGELLCCHENSPGILRALFRNSRGFIHRTEFRGFPNGPYSFECNCDQEWPGFCPHAMAAALHHSKYTIKYRPEEEGKEAPALYAGLKFSGLPELLTQALTPSTAFVSIDAESEFPHVPSKWERVPLTVSLKMGTRQYGGNLNNLRQLHFGKSLAATLQLTAFPQQDRQIIRFLAINAAQDGTKLSLDAEQCAEFFHCLPGFQNFRRLGEKVVVHREPATPILLLEKVARGFLLRSAIVVNGSTLPLKDVKVITGRVGCWVGMLGEYWWIPAQMDVAWLRSFLRTTVQPCDAKAAKMLVAAEQIMPVKIIATGGVKLRQRKFKTMYDAVIHEDGSLEMEVLFDYDGRLCKADQLRLASHGGKFWRRNSKGEFEAVRELVNFGFEMLKGGKSADGETRLILRDREAIGAFIDEVIPMWLRSGREFLMSSSLAALSGDSSNLRMEQKIVAETAEYFDLRLSLYSASCPVRWKDLVLSAKNDEYFINTGNASVFIKLPRPFRRFASAIADIVEQLPPSPSDPDAEFLRIPRSGAVYWAELGAEIPGAVPAEFLRLKLEMESAVQDSRSGELQLDRKLFHGDLRNYQQAGVLWMKTLGTRGFNLILADEMGLGKTIQSLALFSTAPQENLPALIVCPTSLVDNWVREARKFLPDLRILPISGHDRAPLWAKALSQDICVTSYALAKRDFEHIAPLRFKYLVLDEAQHIKNPSSANAQICKSIAADHKLVLTGTPLENSAEDLWSIFDFLHPGMLGSIRGFKNRYAAIHTNPKASQDLSRRISPFILRRRKADVCTELPGKQEQIIRCEMDNGQLDLYNHFRREALRSCEAFRKDGKPAGRIEILTSLLRLRQICCDPALLPEKLLPLSASAADTSADGRASSSSSYGMPPRSAKMELLKEVLMESIDSGHKVLFFSQFTSMLKLVRNWLDSEGVTYEYLDGATKDRQARVDAFNHSADLRLFLLSLKAGGLGLNLTSADTVIIYDPWWNPAAEAQATDRTHRIGQTQPVNCIKLVVRDSIEEKVLELQKRKSELFSNLVEASGAAMRGMDLEDFEFLLGDPGNAFTAAN